MSGRLELIQLWLEDLDYRNFELSRASEDASFRSYLRLATDRGSFIVMDAPPDRESCDSFIRVAEKLRAAGLNAPEVIAADLERGFLLLTDFGNRSYLSQLDQHSMQPLYADAQMVGGAVSERLFDRGLCLPSGSSMSAEQRQRVCDIVASCATTV